MELQKVEEIFPAADWMMNYEDEDEDETDDEEEYGKKKFAFALLSLQISIISLKKCNCC